MNERIDSLGNAAVLSVSDANSGYWKIKIDEADRDETTFTSHHGFYLSIQMLFGLQNAFSSFQLTMDVILSAVKWQFALEYLDNIVVFPISMEEPIALVHNILTLVSDAGVTLKLKNICFFAETVDYLGNFVRPKSSKILSHTLDAICELRQLTLLTKLRSFFWLCNVF